ncbi:MAG: NTP transferase domain-containing protein [Armatimonadetes bacterium]|nr:NTP transferase domain-containing protein [Armatimonadota bacterium]
MKGVVLAAGKGTRLYPVTKVVPKPLLPIANRLTLEYAFDQLKGCGIEEVCIVVGDNEPQIREALGDGSRFGLKLAYARQVEPKGLAHAVGFAKDFVAGDDFVLYLGDAIYDRPLEPHVRRFRESGCANLNLVKPVEDPRRFGVANVDGERIVKLVEKPAEPESNLAMAGMYVFGPQIWDVLPGLAPSARGEYEITDAIQTLVDNGETVLAGVYEGEWFDTGTLDSFLSTTRHVVGGGVLFADGAQVEGPVGENVVIGEGARVVCPQGIEDSVVLPGAEIIAAGPVRHCLIGGAVDAPEGLQDVVRFGTLDA